MVDELLDWEILDVVLNEVVDVDVANVFEIVVSGDVVLVVYMAPLEVGVLLVVC